MKEKIVIDTSVFTNPDTREIFGKTTREAFCNFIKAIEKHQNEVEVYMPVSIFKELQHFLGDNTLPPSTQFVLKLKSPRRYNVTVPGFLIYELIEELRERINKGLRVAEDAVLDAQTVGREKTINALRNKYRDALRAGVIDSKEDVDLLLLSLELDAAIVTADTGVKKWAEKLGIRLIDPFALKSLLENQS